MTASDTKKSTRGFASMSLKRRREVAQKGGKSIPPEKRSFAQDRALASKAGAKGGSNTPAEKRAFSDRKLAAKAGRKGGIAPKKKRKAG